MKRIRIGTRSSKLALWQATTVQNLLAEKGVESELVHIQSVGDVTQDVPLHQIGGVGLFTKALDDALLNNEIDCAVHSCKDLPSTLHSEIIIAAHLVREDPRDILVCKSEHVNFLTENSEAIIATGSVRRKAQWLSKFSSHTLVDLRGNVDTRLQKLKDNDWQGAIFAYAGLKRLNIQPEYFYFPDWMIPAPAQGVVAVVCKKDDVATTEKIAAINHEPTAITTTVERDFLRLMDGGCVAPIGALAVITGDKINFDIAVHSANGTEKVQLHFETSLQHYNTLGAQAYKDAAAKGALTIIQHLK
jgi:hydroxymethylbilane synthase